MRHGGGKLFLDDNVPLQVRYGGAGTSDEHEVEVTTAHTAAAVWHTASAAVSAARA